MDIILKDILDCNIEVTLQNNGFLCEVKLDERLRRRRKLSLKWGRVKVEQRENSFLNSLH